MEHYKIEPNASSILGSLRSIGYNMKTALADIVDNCIAAHATEVEIINNSVDTNDSRLEWVAIIDNGKGMTIDGIKDAFTLGGGGIEVNRSEDDLGRFGLGLKTASFSQCKKLTVLSKTKGIPTIESLVFDLDHVVDHGWEVYSLENNDNIIRQITSKIENKNLLDEDSWTIVLWENLDRVHFIGRDKFHKEVLKIREHLELIYHKFENKLNIRLNGTSIKYWNPFETSNSNEEKEFLFNKENDKYKIRGHVLKHSSEFKNKNEYERQFLVGTSNQNQGFFIYRNNRLIFRGSWLGLYNKEHHYILARVEINLPNSFESDQAWNVNVSKSSVTIPKYAVSDIENECNAIRSEANNVFRFHGGIKKNRIRNNRTSKEIKPIWDFKSKGNKDGVKNYYNVNESHPLMQNFKETISDNIIAKSQFKEIISYIENYLPIDSIFARKANDEISLSETDDSEVYETFKEVFNKYINIMNAEMAFNTLINTEPFNKISFDEYMLDELGIKNI